MNTGLYIKRPCTNELIGTLKIHTQTHAAKLFINQSAGRPNKRIYSVESNCRVCINWSPDRTNCPVCPVLSICAAGHWADPRVTRGNGRQKVSEGTTWKPVTSTRWWKPCLSKVQIVTAGVPKVKYLNKLRKFRA